MVLDSVATMQTNITQKYAITNENTYTKSHIAIDVDSRLILYSQAVRRPKHDTTFAIASIRNLKKHKLEYVIADKAYDTDIDRVAFVGCGASQADLYPGFYFINHESSKLISSIHNANEFVYDTPKSIGKNTIVITAQIVTILVKILFPIYFSICVQPPIHFKKAKY